MKARSQGTKSPKTRFHHCIYFRSLISTSIGLIYCHHALENLSSQLVEQRNCWLSPAILYQRRPFFQSLTIHHDGCQFSSAILAFSLHCWFFLVLYTYCIIAPKSSAFLVSSCISDLDRNGNLFLGYKNSSHMALCHMDHKKGKNMRQAISYLKSKSYFHLTPTLGV